MISDSEIVSTSLNKRVNLKARYANLYRPSPKAVSLVNVPPMSYLTLDGSGDPNTSPEYQQAIEVLYGLAFTAKFLLKRVLGEDFTVMPLEGLWWAPDMEAFSVHRKLEWQWTMMIAQPPVLTPDLFERARAEALRKKPSPAMERVRLEELNEGLCAQIMHIGSYAAEAPTIARLHAFIRAHGFTFDGRTQKHHEIYLSDPRRAAPGKMRTIIRQPITASTVG